MYPAVPTFFPLGTQHLAIFLDGQAGPKLSLGHMPSFVVTGVRGMSLAEQILLSKRAGTEVVH